MRAMADESTNEPNEASPPPPSTPLTPSDEVVLDAILGKPAQLADLVAWRGDLYMGPLTTEDDQTPPAAPPPEEQRQSESP
jgi:hypothetical protein